MDPLTLRLVRAWALNAQAQAAALAAADPTWGTEIHPLGEGCLILAGQGMYINRALAAGVTKPLESEQVELLVSRSAQLGVPPAFEVTPVTLPATIELLRSAGFRHDTTSDVTAFVRYLPDELAGPPADIVVRSVMNETDLSTWKATTAVGWGHLDAQARAASDAFSAAAHVTDKQGMLLAFDASSHQPIGCASVTIRDGVATLGGMSTVPDHRRRGVQAAMVNHRLRFAMDHHCDLAATTAATGGDSARNLRRHAFSPMFRIATWAIDAV